jgi:hypothetical protein
MSVIDANPYTDEKGVWRNTARRQTSPRFQLARYWHRQAARLHQERN